MDILAKNKQWLAKLSTQSDLDSVTQAIKNGQPFDLSSYEIANIGGDGKRDFYILTSGQYGQPLITAEPDRALDLPASLKYVTAQGNEIKPTEKLGGFIIRENSGAISYRYSLTNAHKSGVDLQGFQPSDASFLVDGKTYWLNALFSKDKNRYINYDGFFSPNKTARVMVYELSDLRL